MTPRISYLNGNYLDHQECLIHIEDRGFQFADSVYEVILLYQGKLVEADNHLERLKRSLSEMGINFTFDTSGLLQDIYTLFEKNNINNGFCYLSVSRGCSPRIRSWPSDIKATISITVNSLEKPKSLNGSIKATISEDIRWLRCDIKSTALAAPSMMLEKAINAGFDEVIMVRDGFVTEASFANIFIVDSQGTLITRHADNLILQGITRNRIILIARSKGIKVIERNFTVHEMLAAKEVFTTASTSLIKSVSKINNKLIGDGQSGLANILHESYLEFISN